MKLKFMGNGPFGSTTRKNSSAYLLQEEELLIIDLGINVGEDYKKIVDREQIKKITIAITHNHPDHSGGLGEFLIWSFFQKQIKRIVIFSSTLVLEKTKAILFDQGIYYVLQKQQNCQLIHSIEKNVFSEDFSIQSFETEHTELPSCGFLITNNKKKFKKGIVYSGDTKYALIKNAIEYCKKEQIELEKIYHEVSVEQTQAHTYYKDLIKQIEETNFPKEKVFVFHTDETKENLEKVGLNLAIPEVL